MKQTFEEYCNEPAFPVRLYGLIDHAEHSPMTGITRLEYFTAKALNAVIQQPSALMGQDDPYDAAWLLAGAFAMSTLKKLYELPDTKPLNHPAL